MENVGVTSERTSLLVAVLFVRYYCNAKINKPTNQVNTTTISRLIIFPLKIITIHLDEADIFSNIQVLPRTLFPVLKRHHTRSHTPSRLPLFTRRTLYSRFSFGARSSFRAWWSLRSSLPWAAQITFDSFTSISTITTW